jgi:hypothetical protein
MLMSYNRSNLVHSTGLYYLSEGSFSARDIGAILSSDDLSIGIDKVKVSWEPKSRNPSPDLWKVLTVDQVDGATRGNAPLVVGCGVAILRFSSGSPTIASIEFNPSSILNEDRSLAGLDEMYTALEQVLGMANETISISPSAGDYMLTRLDLAVDFEPVGDLQNFLDLATRTKPFRRVRSQTYKSPSTLEVESVYFTTRTNDCLKFYNKSLEQGDAGKRLRIELTLSRKSLVRLEIPSLVSLTESTLRFALCQRLSNLIDACLKTPTAKAEEILNSPQHSKTFVTAAGYEYLEQHGHHAAKSDYWWRTYKEFQNKYPHIEIKDLL